MSSKITELLAFIVGHDGINDKSKLLDSHHKRITHK